jgi:hypothetical protein
LKKATGSKRRGSPSRCAPVFFALPTVSGSGACAALSIACLDIYADGKLIGQVLANRYRKELAKAGIGSGHHGFEFTSPIALSPDTTEVRRSLDGAAVTCTSDAPGALASAARASGIRHIAGRSDAFVRVHRRAARA